MSIGGNTPEYANGTARFTNTTVSNNVLVEIGRSRPTNRTLSWGVSAPLFKTRCTVVVGHGLEVNTIAVFTTPHVVQSFQRFQTPSHMREYTIPSLHIWCITHPPTHPHTHDPLLTYLVHYPHTHTHTHTRSLAYISGALPTHSSHSYSNSQLGVSDWQGGVITNNLFLNVTEPTVLNTYALAFQGSVHDVVVSSNIVYNLHSDDALLEVDTDKVSAVEQH
jgi:hypothetical protein